LSSCIVSHDYVNLVWRGCCVVIIWSRSGQAKIGVLRAEGPWKANRKLVYAILVSLICGAGEGIC